MSRRPSYKSVAPVILELEPIPSNSRTSSGSNWTLSLEKLCEFCLSENYNSYSDVNVNNDTIGRPLVILEADDHGRLAEMIESDVSRCCFLSYRQGNQRQLLKRLVLKVLYGELPASSTENPSPAAVAASKGLAMRAVKGLSYRQGLLSLLAPIIEIWFPNDFYEETSSVPARATSSSSYVITPDDDLRLNQCSETLFSILFCFPSLSNYLQAHGSIDAFQNVFDSVMRVLMYWVPSIASTLGMHNFYGVIFLTCLINQYMLSLFSMEKFLPCIICSSLGYNING